VHRRARSPSPVSSKPRSRGTASRGHQLGTATAAGDFAEHDSDAAAAKPNLLRSYQLFGRPPVLPSENPADYYQLLVRIAADIGPQGTIEEAWVWDITCLTWEMRRLRRIKNDFIGQLMPDFLQQALARITGMEADSEPMTTLINAWSAGKPSSVRRIERDLASINLAVDAVAARAFVLAIDEIERFHRLISITEARRNAIIREFDRHRAVRQALHGTFELVDDAQFEEIQPTLATPDPSADEQ
jgi:hypothetical protein